MTGGRSRATAADVARAAGVSRGTVGRVLNGGYVSAEARAAVEAAVARVGYVPNTAARSLVRRRSQAVAFLVHEPHPLFLEDPNIGAVMLGANEALSLADHQLVCLVLDSDRDAERVGRYLSGGLVDGAILVSARFHDVVADAVVRSRLPAAFVGRPPHDGTTPYVGIDNVGAARAITRRLMATRRARIGMIAAGLDRDSGADRLAGFRQAMGDRFDPDLVVTVPFYEFRAGAEAMAELLRRDPAVDGVVAASDALAAGALETLAAAGRSVPGDVGVVGFDDSSWARRSRPALSTVHQPAAELGRRAADLVLAQLRGEDLAGTTVLLDTPVVWRDSA